MRIRSTKPEFWLNEKMAARPAFTRLLAIALKNWADDEGYFLANERLIHTQLFPFEDDSRIIPGSLRQLFEDDYLRLGNGSDGRRYGWIVRFLEDQRVEKPKPSEIKDLVKCWEKYVSVPGNVPEASPLERRGEEWSGEERKGESIAPSSRDLGAAPAPELKLHLDAVERKLVPVLVFPCVGKDRTWPLTQEHIDELQVTYPGINVASQAREAWQWATDNPAKRKTADGMRRFLSNWMKRAQNDLTHANNRHGKTRTHKISPDLAPSF